MAEITYPSGLILPASLQWGLAANTQAFTSPLSQASQTLELPGARWTAILNYPPLIDAETALLQAFVIALKGRANRVRMWNMARPNPRGNATGAPVVNGAAQLGNTLTTSGWTPSTAVLKAGDFVGIGGELKMITADLSSNGSGLATLAFSPPLRASPTDSSAIVTTKPTALMRLDGDDQSWLTSPGLFTEYKLSLVESFT